MKYTLKLLTLLIILIAFFSACEKKEDQFVEEEIINNDAVNKITNEWIWDEMDAWYLWRDFLPSKQVSTSDPNIYFNSILYTAKDRWSYISENYKDLVNGFQGIEKSMGYSLALYLFQDRVVGYVEFVYPNTPAAKLGIERGDIISKVNSQNLTIDNYIDLLYNTDNQILTFAIIQNRVVNDLDHTLTISAEVISENPVIIDTIYHIADKKIGYLMYVGFIPNFNYELDRAFSNFYENDITDLILDFRYNPGGNIDAANYLCSSIAPESIVKNKSRLVNFNWNNEVQSYIESQGWYDNLYVDMLDDTNVNLNLTKVTILTTGGTASASELTITGLEPYMDVVTVGETTHGKYTASITLPDEDSIWALQPIVIKYSNSEGVTNFIDGFIPDYRVEDNFKWDIGDVNDPMIKKAISLITGIETKSTHLEDDNLCMHKLNISIGRNPRIQNGILDITHKIKFSRKFIE